jgi:RNA polymerase sigma-70 factor (ECF subfamily)
VIRQAVESLPPHQRQVLLLRDVEDVAAEDVCNILAISETNLRVLLHRARARVRRALDRHLRDDDGPSCDRARSLTSTASNTSRR